MARILAFLRNIILPSALLISLGIGIQRLRRAIKKRNTSEQSNAKRSVDDDSVFLGKHCEHQVHQSDNDVVSSSPSIHSASNISTNDLNKLEKLIPERKYIGSLFTGKLWELFANKQNENVVISPFSIHTALSMVAMGARGNTLEELERALNISVNDQAWRELMRNKQESVKIVGEKRVFKEITNALLISDDIEVEQKFLDDLCKIFDAHPSQANFVEHPETARLDFNQRVENQTRGLIKEALPHGSIHADVKAILSNVIYFNGSWLKPFKNILTRNGSFLIDDAHSVDVPMMRICFRTFSVANLSDFNAKTIFLPYKDRRHGMLIILPNEKNGLREVESRLLTSGVTPNELLERMHAQKVNLTLPKFKVNFKCEIRNIVKKMGIVDMFSERRTDFSGITLTLRLHVENEFHKSIIELNEQAKTSAAASAAATAATLIKCPGELREPFVFTANHPFLFYLIDLENVSVPLFVGRVSNPLSQ